MPYVVIQWYVLDIGKSENSSVLEASYIQYSIYYSYIRYILHCMLVPGTVPVQYGSCVLLLVVSTTA